MGPECRGEHIAIGTEILLGQILNAHARTVSLTFANHGFFIYHHHAVGDNLVRIVEVLRASAARSNVVVVTGGLGPTEDDLTREATAEFLGRTLCLDAAALSELEQWFKGRGRAMPEENRRQAMRIDGAEMLPNPNGTAPGQYVEDSGVHYFLLPGPPLEMKPMLDAQVIPRLQQLFPNERALVSRTLHFCGIGESAVDEQIPDLLHGENPTVAPLAGEGEMLLRITAAGATVSEANAFIEPVEHRLRHQFEPFIYGADGDTLPIVVARRLQSMGKTVATAESCTGGLVSSMLTDVPGVSSVFMGGAVVYHNQMKESLLGVRSETLAEVGAVSEQTAAEMAQGIRAKLGVDYGISTTGIAGPGGATEGKPVGLVYVAVAGPGGTEVYRCSLRGSREQIRIRAAKQLLWRLTNVLSRDART